MGLGWLLPILVPTRPVQLVLWRAGDRPGQTRSRTPCLPRTFPRKLVPTAGFEPATHGLGKHQGTGNDGTGRDGTGRDGGHSDVFARQPLCGGGGGNRTKPGKAGAVGTLVGPV